MEIRLDFLVSKKGNFSRSKAQVLIREGKVEVEDRVITKPAFVVNENTNIVINLEDNYVSRGAFKLKKALEVFDVSINDKIALDMGASTGGFTQIALEKGAKKVYAVDVGKGELDESLARHPKVINLEGTDIRLLTKEMVEETQIVVGDLSFISLKHILPKINALFGNIECILLFKPQFECGKEIARKSRGVIKDKNVHKKLLQDFLKEINGYDFIISNLTFSPIKGKSGNVEYLLHINGKEEKKVDIDKVVNDAFLTSQP